MRRARRLFVREDRREVVRRTARTLEHLAAVVRTVSDLIFTSDRLDLTFVEAERAALSKRAERHKLHRVTGLADFAIDLEAALELLLVEMTEWTGEGPAEARRLRRVTGRGIRRDPAVRPVVGRLAGGRAGRRPAARPGRVLRFAHVLGLPWWRRSWWCGWLLG